MDTKTNLQEKGILDDLNAIFDDFIKSGTIAMEKEVVPGFKVALKVLSTGELLSAEAVISASNPNIPFDIMQKVRAASILSQAITSINGVPIEREGFDKDDVRARRNALYSQMLKMPALVVQETYKLYMDAFAAQNELYANHEQARTAIENF